jgi:aminotransferase
MRIANRVRQIGKSAIHEMTLYPKRSMTRPFYREPNRPAIRRSISKNAISAYTFTMTYAMTGWRIGYLHADEELIPQITKAHILFPICAPVVSQYAALAALQGTQDCVREFREHYLSARNLMCKRLVGLSKIFANQKPRGSYLMFPKILIDEGRDSTEFCERLLRKDRDSATPGIAFVPAGLNHLRLSFCVPDDIINKAFDHMEKYFGIN